MLQCQPVSSCTEMTKVLLSAEAVLDPGLKTCIGIYGMGGIGKTTIAQRLRDDLRSSFQRIIFIVVGQTPNVQDLLQAQFRNLSGPTGGMPPVFKRRPFVADAACAHLAGMLGSRTLLILDDVWEVDHLAELDFATYSGTGDHRVIVTTRNQSIFDCKVKEQLSLHEVPLLSDENARALLVHYAFPLAVAAPREYEDVVESLVRECKNLPLALQVCP